MLSDNDIQRNNAALHILPVEGKSSVCVMCLKYRIIILITIIISLGQILLSYIPNTPHTVVIIAHHKRIGYVIIPTPNLSSREDINYRCRCCPTGLWNARFVHSFTTVCKAHRNSGHCKCLSTCINYISMYIPVYIFEFNIIYLYTGIYI